MFACHRASIAKRYVRRCGCAGDYFRWLGCLIPRGQSSVQVSLVLSCLILNRSVHRFDEPTFVFKQEISVYACFEFYHAIKCDQRCRWYCCQLDWQAYICSVPQEPFVKHPCLGLWPTALGAWKSGQAGIAFNDHKELLTAARKPSIER